MGAFEIAYGQFRPVPRPLAEMNHDELNFWRLEVSWWHEEARRPGSVYRRRLAAWWKRGWLV